MAGGAATAGGGSILAAAMNPSTVDHYENFPVASLLLPAAVRPAVAAIYAFARGADDIADEGDAPAAERLRQLALWRQELERVAGGGDSDRPEFKALGAVIARHRLPLAAFHALLDAFAQDVVKPRYASFAELMDYCRRSANPVGRLMLALFEVHGEDDLYASDAICSALQLINHWQDVAIDYARGRLYLPQEDLRAFGVDEAAIAVGRCDARWQALLRFQVERARALMLSGAPLGRRLPGRFGLEIRAIVHGGLRILERIESVNYDVFRHRPTLGRLDWPLILWRAW